VLQDAGAQVHLAHPLGVKGFAYRRVKNDVRDAVDLADLLRMDRLPEGWIAPPQVRLLREMVRHRAKLVAWRSGLKTSEHGVLAKQGLHPTRWAISRPAGAAESCADTSHCLRSPGRAWPSDPATGRKHVLQQPDTDSERHAKPVRDDCGRTMRRGMVKPPHPLTTRAPNRRVSCFVGTAIRPHPYEYWPIAH
jgi:hypothetical protein